MRLRKEQLRATARPKNSIQTFPQRDCRLPIAGRVGQLDQLFFCDKLCLLSRTWPDLRASPRRNVHPNSYEAIGFREPAAPGRVVPQVVV